MKILNLLALLTLSILFSSCNLNSSTVVNNQYPATVQPTINTNANRKTEVNTKISKTNEVEDKNSQEVNEIKDCSPQKIFKGETLTISFKDPHGQNFAIYNEKTRDFYFLTANDRYYFPYVHPDKFRKYLSLEFDTAKVRSMSEEIDSEGYNKSKPYFTKTGWYRVIIAHQALDVDFIDMPITGSCRVYYVNEERPQEK